jgi:multisubunit Na+/H+ antiporter MnhF subunit
MTTYGQDKGPTILTVMWTTTSIAILFVIARLYIRYRIVKNPGLDDILITVSMVNIMTLRYSNSS